MSDMARYIDADALLEKYERAIKDDWNKRSSPISWADAYECVIADIDDQPTAEAVEVVRCKDCKWFVPKHIKLDDGTTRAYTEEEKKLPLGVSGDVGINCGSRCLRCFRWEENSIPVFVQENDFCSYGERKE